VQQKVIHAGVNSTSFEQAHVDLRVLAELDVPVKQVQRLTRRIGAERVAERDAAVAAYEALPLAEKHLSPPAVAAPPVAVIMVDGGRLQIRDAAAEAPESVPAAALAPAVGTELPAPAPSAAACERGQHWREDRVGLLLGMDSAVQNNDPCPDIPEHFIDPTRILKLAREVKPVRVGEEAAACSASADETAEKVVGAPGYEPPEVVERRVLASRHDWHDFAPQVAQAARAMGLLGAARKAFVGDGAENNWTLWRRFFGSFVPVLDFIHALSYVFAAALAARKFPDGWPIYVRWISWVWQGHVERVIAELAQRQAELGAPAPDEVETNPRRVVARALTYLQNHKDKMRYDAYRQQGLPLTSSHVESLIKEINRRVKGTEKFWCEAGAEPILQLRADVLSHDQPLVAFWQRRQARETGQRRYREAA
jgi:hypothetical protein